MSCPDTLRQTISLENFYQQLKSFSLVRISQFSQDESCAVCIWVDTSQLKLVQKTDNSGEFQISCAYPSGAAHSGDFFFTIAGSKVFYSETPGLITSSYQIHTHGCDYFFTGYH